MAKKKGQNVNLSVEEKLKYLYELQLVNSKLDELKKLQGELPLEVEALENDILSLVARVDTLKEEQEELQQAIVKSNTQIQESESLIERYNSQQDEVKNNREYEALTREVELQRLDIQLAKKRIYETQVKIERKAETLLVAKERKDNKEMDLQLKKDELEKIIGKTEKKEKTYGNKEKRARKKIDASLLAIYDRIRGAYKNGLAIATIERDACGGCYSQVPPQLQLDMTQRKKIISCEHCGRILVESNILDEAVIVDEDEIVAGI